MLTLMMALATVMALERPEINWKRSIRWTAAITLCIALPIGLMPHESEDIKDLNGNPITVYGLEDYPHGFGAMLRCAVQPFPACAFIRLLPETETAISKVDDLCRRVHLGNLLHLCDLPWKNPVGSCKRSHYSVRAERRGGPRPSGDLQNVRSDFYESMDNAAMFWQIPSIQAFHSIVPGSIMNSTLLIGVTRDVGSRPDTTHVGLRALTSCRWLFGDMDDDAYFGGEARTTRKCLAGPIMTRKTASISGKTNTISLWDSITNITSRRSNMKRRRNLTGRCCC